MTRNLKLLINFVKKFLGTVKFRNDQIAPILGYGDLVQGAVMIKRVYYVEGLNHNLFSVGQFWDANLEVTFRKSTCYIRDLKGNALLIDKKVSISEGSPVTRTESYMETYKTVSQDIRDQLNAKAEAVQIILTRIDNDIYSTVDACPNACEMWKAIERLKQGESINVQDLETNLYWEMNSSTRSQQATTRNRGKAIVNSPQPIYDQEPSMVVEDDETSKDKEINKLMAETVGSIVVQKSGIQRYNCKEFGHVSRECQKLKRVKHAAYHREKMLLCKQEELNAEQADWRDDTDDELKAQELEAHYTYMAQLQEVSPDVADSRPIFDAEPIQKVSTDDHYNVFAIESEHPEQSESVHDTYSIEQDEHNVIIDSLDMSYDREQIDQNDQSVHDIESEHPEQSESVHDTYPIEQDEHNVIIDSLDMSYDREQIDQNDDDADLVNEREIEDFKNKNKSLESSNNCFKEANNKLSETNNLLYNDFKKSQAEFTRRNDVEYASKVEIDCVKARGDLISYIMESQKSFNKYTQTINDLNQTIFEMKKKLCANQETISILSQQKEAQIKLYKTREDNELDKLIALENKVNVLDNIVYKTGQSVQTMNMLNNKCRTSFAKPEFLKKAQRPNPRLYDIGCYNDNLALMLAPESDEVVSKSSAVSTADALNQRQQQKTTPLNNQATPDPTCQVPTQALIVASTKNINQAEMVEEYVHVENDEFINIFCTLHHPSEHRWTKDHPLEQVIVNPSQSVRTRRQLESDGEMRMFALIVSRTEPKNIKEAMADSAWIESM
nr:integrase, catalytic region, zinc finger, CCHC-type, peptidase aspartic, catalytic [Tanacetum cinerariifolium]